ncbi:hypothetical protein NQZ79_g7155 [Umbelopsis isabellina]|nr:hypothetical protein NQZ79_g7155 [Umbelopsis isabellina]
MDVLKRYVSKQSETSASSQQMFKRRSTSELLNTSKNTAHRSSDDMLSNRFKASKTRSMSFTTVLDADKGIRTIVADNDLVMPEFNIKQLDSALQTAFVVLSSCDTFLGHLPNKLKETLVCQAHEASSLLPSDQLDSASENGNHMQGVVGSAQSLIDRLYTQKPTTSVEKPHMASRASLLSTRELQLAVKNGATFVKSSSASDVTDSCSTVTSEPSSPITPSFNDTVFVIDQGVESRFDQLEPLEKHVVDVATFPFTNAYTNPRIHPSHHKKDDSWVFSKRATGIGLADQVHSVLGDAIKQADFELRWEQTGDWEESDDEDAQNMTEQDIRDYEYERQMAMQRNPIQRHLSANTLNYLGGAS